MNTKPDKRKITVHIPTEIVDALRKKAQENQRSFNGELVRALQEYLSKKKDK